MHRPEKNGAAIIAQRVVCLHPWIALAVVLGLLTGCAGSPQRHGAASVPMATQNATARALQGHYEQWRGVPYRYGGTDRSGIDCSSFVQRILADLDAVSLPRTTRAQARVGRPVARGAMAPGDLVFFKTGIKSRHVGIYVGEGHFMHASTSRGVTISRLDNPYWRRNYWQARRP